MDILTITTDFSLSLKACVVEEEHHGLTVEALIDVDNNDVIDHQSVQAWAESLI